MAPLPGAKAQLTAQAWRLANVWLRFALNICQFRIIELGSGRGGKEVTMALEGNPMKLPTKPLKALLRDLTVSGFRLRVAPDLRNFH